MNVLANVFHGVVNNLMLVGVVESFMRLQRIAVKLRSRFHVVVDQLLQDLLLAALHQTSADLAATLQHSRYNGLAFRSTPFDLPFAILGVHATRLATDEGFVNLDLTRQRWSSASRDGNAGA